MAKKQLPLVPHDVLIITERVACGEKMLAVLKELGITPLRFFSHLNANPEDKLMFDEARKVAIEVLVDESSELFNQINTKMDLDVAKEKVGLRKWMAEKLISGVYGTKIQHDVSGTINIRAAMGEAKGRLEDALNAKYHEVKDPTVPSTRKRIEFYKQDSQPSANATTVDAIYKAAPNLKDAEEDAVINEATLTEEQRGFL